MISVHMLYRIKKRIHQFVANLVRYIPTKYYKKTVPSRITYTVFVGT